VQAAARQQPLVLVVEDVHWLDSASWALIAGAQQSVHPLMLVVVTRPWENTVPAEWTRLLALPITQHLPIENLPAEQAITLVCQRLGVAEIPPAAADLITSKAEGHPFWSEEIAYTLRDTGVLIIEDGVCRLAPYVGGIADIDIPNTIQGIITSRIDRLSASQQLAIKVASVIGRVFLLTTLMDIYPVPGDRPRLPGDLGSLSSLDVTPLNNTGQLTYFFKHVITQNVAYSLIPFAQRRLLHRSIAEWFEQTYRQDLEPYYPALVHHWRAAEDPAKLIDALEQAGAHALHSGAYLEAATAFRDALAVASEQPAPPPILRRARWERQLGQALAGLGNVAESQAHLETALELLQQPVPGGSRRVMLGWVEQMASQLGRQWRPAALAGPAQQETYLEAARAYYELWTLYNGSNEPIMALHAAWRMLNLAEMAGPSPELGQAYALVCFLSMAVPRVADSYERRARSAAQSITRPAERSRLLLPLGRYYAYTGHWLEAEQALGEALAIAANLGDRRQWEEIAGDIAMMAYHRGQFGRGAALGESIRASARERASTFAASLGLYTQALNLLPLGEISQAIPILEEGTALLEEQRSDLYRITSWGLLALAYAERGELEQAERAAEKVVQVAAQSSPAAVVGFGYPGATEVWLRLWEQSGDDAARRHYARQAEQMVKQVRQAVRLAPVFQPSGWRLRGLAAYLRGHQQTAYNAWWYGLQAAERLSMPYQAALLHATIARLGPAAERSLHTRLADDIFRQLEVPAELS
jgi:tetratricopeptide (TPR) repeat protein